MKNAPFNKFIMYVRKEKTKNLSHTLNILQYNKKKEQKERKNEKNS